MEGGRKGSESVLEERSPAVTEKEAIASTDSTRRQRRFFLRICIDAPFSRQRVLSALRFSPWRRTVPSPAVGTPSRLSSLAPKTETATITGGATESVTELLLCPAVTT